MSIFQRDRRDDLRWFVRLIKMAAINAKLTPTENTSAYYDNKLQLLSQVQINFCYYFRGGQFFCS